MNRRHIILLAMLLTGALLAVWLHRPRMLPASMCSQAYRTYCHTPGIDATFLKDFGLDDSVAVDVTILAAVDSAMWDTLLRDFHIPAELIAIMRQQRMAVTTKMTPKGCYDQRPDSLMANNELLIVAPLTRSVYVIDLENEAQYMAVMRYKYNYFNNEDSYRLAGNRYYYKTDGKFFKNE